MGLKAGIIGLPNVGKSTIFNALTKSAIPADNYPFCTIDPNIGIVEVPDNRLNAIAKIYSPKATTPTTIEFVDIAGLVRGASKGEGLGNQFLSNIRDVNAIIHIIRAFETNDITHIDGNLDPIRDIETIETELLIKDILSIEKRIDKLNKTIRMGDKDAKIELSIFDYILPKMNDGTLVRNIPLDSKQKQILQILSLLTNKPTLYVLNIDENQIINTKTIPNFNNLINFINTKGDEIILLSGKIESEISTLNKNEIDFYLKEYNISEPGLNKLVKATYNLLKLETFFTAGEKEVRAWTIKKGTLAPKAASEIHSDIERGFIKAEVFSYEDLMHLKSETAIKDAGKVRLEGKNYIVQNGDIILFKFNV
tara:strand:- start:218 stop:1318 length:1101 start_codon:yes stop_codon:yes gene_type:complete